MMSTFFQLPIVGSDGAGDDPFKRFGLTGNPFPASGVDSGVLYQDHVATELRQIQTWINDVSAATDPNRTPRSNENLVGPVRPLAVFGSLGVGKTHLLSYLEQGLHRNASTPALRKGLADEGMKRIMLSDLFLRYLPHADEGTEPGTGLLRKLVAAASSNRETSARMHDALRVGSPLKIPFFAAVDATEPDAVLWLSRWLRREYTTPNQRSKLGLSATLQSEGEAVRAIADLARLAHAAGILRAWFVFIDQLEELWRPNVITAMKRARFLTDLRFLVDQALEGAPIAVLLAWNTTVEANRLGGPPDVRTHMETDYRALLQRLGTPVDLPMLRPEDVWPFADRYLEAAEVRADSRAGRGRLFEHLSRAAADVTRERVADGTAGLAPRKVLAAWRAKAEEIATNRVLD